MKGINTILFAFTIFIFTTSYQITSPPSIENFCTKNTTSFSLEPIEFQIRPTDCFKGLFKYTRVFSFKAKTDFLDFTLRTSDGLNAIKDPVIYLMDEDFNVIHCAKQHENETSIGLLYEKLEKKKKYLIGIYSNYARKGATFGFCINTIRDNGHFTGATKIEGESYTSEEGAKIHPHTASFPGTTCLPSGPNHNVWYTFTATKQSTHIEIKTPEAKTKIEFPIVGLFDANMHQLACSGYDKKHNTTLDYYKLEKGKTYFFSIDHKHYESGMGEYVLEFNQTDELNYVGNDKIVGKILNTTSAHPIELKDKKTDKVIQTIQSNEDGTFEFNKLPAGVDYLIDVKTEENIALEVFLIDEHEDILVKSSSDSEQVELNTEFDPNKLEFKLISQTMMNKVLIEQGKTGLVGKVIEKSFPFTGKIGLNVNLYDHNNVKVFSSTTDKNGEFFFSNLKKDRAYAIQFEIDQVEDIYGEMAYINDKKQAMMYSNTNLMGEDGRFHFQKLPTEKAELAFHELEEAPLDLMAFELNPGNKFTLDRLLFKSGSSEILESSYMELDNLLEALEEKEVTLNVLGYTDNVGNATSNTILSEKRAKAVVLYLLIHDISPDRLSYKGMGPKNPIADNSTKEGQAKNRRVEIEVIE